MQLQLVHEVLITRAETTESTILRRIIFTPSDY